MTEDNREGGETGLEIAVIGMAGRFPGAKDIAQFWENLKNGVESISFFSKEELEQAGVDAETLADPNFVRAAGYLEDKGYFDASFFDYTPIEAEILDPQVRLFHECCWQALEVAGYNPAAYNRLIGLYAGASHALQWEAYYLLSEKTNLLGAYAASLLRKDYLCARTSYKLGLKGPAVNVQTACSTSLVALHLACQGLLGGECDIALAGGVTVTHQGKRGYMYEQGMIGSPDGHCRAFDARAGGTVGSEGIGIVVLKRLQEAVADRDYIYAVVKGSAINNDGDRKVGFTAPSITGQAAAIRAALQMAGVQPETIGYIETHGTGTILGDPVEISALKKVYKTGREKHCALGAVKTNIGHTDSAAGIAGFIKTVLILHHRLIPPTLHFQTPNPELDIENSPFYVNTTLKEWKNDPHPRRAGVSSFGIGGTNAHVVLEEYTQRSEMLLLKKENSQAVQTKEGAALPAKTFDYLLLLSAKTLPALEQQTTNLVQYFKENPGINLADAAYTLQVGRRPFKYKRFTVCQNPTNTTFTDGVADTHGRPIIFMFPGQGSQYINMGFDLYKYEPLFRHELNLCFNILKTSLSLDLEKIIYPPDNTTEDKNSEIDQTAITQPLLFSFEYALAKLLLSWGIKPQAMIGHSIGEYTAACLAGVFTPEEGLILTAKRGQTMQEITPGAMLAVSISEEEVQPFLNQEISLAAVNTPNRCVVSGPHHAITTLEEQLKKEGCETRRLHTSHAFHSPMMDPAAREFHETVGKIPFREPTIPYISNLTGHWITPSEILDPQYWTRHLRETVRFSQGLQELLKTENAVFIEIGPGNTLSTFLNQHPAKKKGQAAINLIKHPRDQEGDVSYLLNKIGRLWLHGIPIDWKAFHSQEQRKRIPLPTYPFERTQFPDSVDFRKINIPLLTGKTSLVSQPGELPVKTPEIATGELKKDENELEQTLARIFGQFFGSAPVGIHDDFYELGVDSLNSVQLANLVRQAGMEITFQEILMHRDIHELCKNLTPGEKANPITPGPGITNQVSQAEYDRLLEELKINDQLTDWLKESSIMREYAVSPVQKYSLVPPYSEIAVNFIYYYHDFTQPIDFARIKELFTGLVQQNSLLRSIIIQRDGNYLVREFQASTNPNPCLPIIDLTPYSEACREEIISMINRRLTEPLDVIGNVLYRATVLKKGEGYHTLIIQFNHLIFDGASIAILENQLQNLIRGIGMTEPGKSDDPGEPLYTGYCDYVEFMNRQDYTNAGLEKYLNLDIYIRSIAEILEKYPHPLPDIKVQRIDLDISTLNENIKNYYEEIILLAYALMIHRAFKIEKVPIGYVSNGRIYKGGRFTKVIGDFHDEIPVLFDFTGQWQAQIRALMENFIAYKRFIKEKNLNFVNYVIKGNIPGIENAANSEKITTPFGFNALTGSYDYFNRIINAEQETELLMERRDYPFFSLGLREKFYEGKLRIEFIHNSGLTVKEEFLGNYNHLLQALT